MNKEFEIKFWSKVDIKSEDECWIWKGSKSRGYGKIRLGNKLKSAHRVSYLLFHKNINDKLDCCHTCDNPSCVNPKHLFLGTTKDNIKDMYNKNRQPIQVGSDIGTSKLDEKQILEIRRLHNEDGFSLRKIGKLYNVDYTTISDIIRRKSWRHV